MQNLWIDTKEKSQWDWEVLPYHEESRENESYNDIVVDTTKVNEKQLDIKTSPIILKEKLEGMLDDQIFNMEMEVKLGQLIKIFPQLWKILAKFSLRTEEEHVPHVCIIGIHHKNDFDEVMLVVQVSIGNYEIMDVLLDGGFGDYFQTHVEEIRLEKTLVITIHGESGRSKKSATSRVDMEPQNWISRVYI